MLRLTVLGMVDHYRHTRPITDQTYFQYRAAVRAFSKWLGRQALVSDLTAEKIGDFIRAQLSSGLSTWTVHGRRQYLATLWKHAHEHGIVATPPKRLPPVRRVYSPPRAWTIEEVRRLLTVIRVFHGTYPPRVPRSLWWELYVRLQWDTGLRQGDLLALCRRDIREDGTISVVQSKTGYPHVCRVHASTLELVRMVGMHCAETSELVLPWQLSHETRREHFRMIVLFAGLQMTRQNILRKSGASAVEAASPGHGRIYLGHSIGTADIATRHYFDPTITQAEIPIPPEL